MEVDCIWTEGYAAELKKIDQQAERFIRVISGISSLNDKSVMRMLNEMNFKWNATYNVGVRKIDVQHRNFLQIIRQIFIASNKGANRKKISRLLDKLLRYAQHHFKTEEQLMARYGYPKLAEQKREHQILMMELDKHVSSFRESDGSIPKLLYFLIQWFVKHTTYSDKDIGVYIVNRRRRLARRFNPLFWGKTIASSLLPGKSLKPCLPHAARQSGSVELCGKS